MSRVTLIIYGGIGLKAILYVFCIVICGLLLFACTDATGDAPPATSPGLVNTPGATSTPPVDTPGSTPAQTPDGGSDIGDTQTATGEVIISFEFVRQSGAASNQHAVWIEDMEGNIVKTLYASRWTATGGFARRPDSLIVWAERADLANMPSNEVDAVAGATPTTGLQSYTWDLTDMHDNTVMQRDYMFFVEGTLRWKNFVLYSGVITIGENPMTVQGEAIFHYEGTDRHAILNASSVENNMIGPVTVSFTP